MVPARPSWYARARGSVATWWRSVVSGVQALRAPPSRPGISAARVGVPHAERDLQALETAPAVYGGLTRNAFGIASYPIDVMTGFSYGSGRMSRLDPNEVPWVAGFHRLLATPDPATSWDLFPEPGEGLIAQIWADLKMSGAFVVAPTLSDAGDMIGLARLHPVCCAIDRKTNELVYKNGPDVRRYPRGQVCVGRLLSWARDGRAEWGVGAGAPLEPLVRAERNALEQTATMIAQGGADVVVTGKGATGINLMANKESREATVRAVTTALAGEGGRRVFAYSGDIEVKDSGLKPADLRAPELLSAARANELAAINVVPAWVGLDAGTYANGILQFRTQYDSDLAFAGVIEAYLLRPVARYFARRAGGRAALRADRITARFNLEQHPGAVQLRTDQLTRARTLQQMGWTNAQAAEIEGLDLPEPLGQPMGGPTPAELVPGPDQGSTQSAPRRPVGDQGTQGTGEPANQTGARAARDL